MSVYGEQFAAVYNRDWAFFAARMWPFLRDTVRRLRPDARWWLDLPRSGFRFRKHDGRTFGRPRKRSGGMIYVCRRA